MSAAHRAWLEHLREKFLTSGLTIAELAQRAGWSKSKVSELLRGAGLYPRWEITHGLLHVLGVPTRPMRRLRTAAAREARKKQDWIDGCITKVVVSTGPAVPPLDHLGFTELNRGAYTAYARVFLRRDEAERTVAETSDVLWLRWEDVLVSSDVQKFSWQILRRGVMARTPHIDGYPELTHAVFDTVVLSKTSGPAGFNQIEESLRLFQAISRLPPFQLDVLVLRYMRGMGEEAVADVLGAPIASVSSADRHAQRSLANALNSSTAPGGTLQ
ncbi:helix-turn-helix domain-containing protein [Streptomyces sp. x-80]|uniref:helix-turn-helix domain-containing protein n=1 Tax=Streptomyces sp. x-80 TaxID=2789282 RepID=UPI00397F3500